MCRPLTESSSAHFRSLTNAVARLAVIKPPALLLERYGLVNSAHADWSSLDPFQDFNVPIEQWTMAPALISAYKSQTHLGVLTVHAFNHVKNFFKNAVKLETEELKYEGLLSKAEIQDATVRDVRDITEANRALVDSRQPTLDALLELCEDPLIREVTLSLGASEDIPPAMTITQGQIILPTFSSSSGRDGS